MKNTWWVGPEQLNDEQGAVIALPLRGSHLVTGPPGCGKTNLLLLRANYMSLAGQPNILVLVFTRTLQEFIAAGGHQYDFPPSKVMTCRRWEQTFLHSYGIKATPPDDFDEQRKYFVDQIEQLIKNKKLGQVYDAILLDEAQDYLPEEIMMFKKLCKILFATADSRQKIYNVEDCMETLKKVVDQQHALHHHYRIGTKICKLADALSKDTGEYEPLLPTCNYDESSKPSSVEHHRCGNKAEEGRKIIEKLEIQLKAYPDELLGVVCPMHEALDEIWEEIAKSKLGGLAVLQAEGEHTQFDAEKRICVCTLHSAKGLEVRALHIAGCELLRKFPHQRNLAFTAVTRAKTSLSLYYSGDIPGYLEKALVSLEPLPDLPKLKDVFGGKKHVG